MPQRLEALLRDPDRLAALRNLSLLDTEQEPAFDRLTRLAARIIRAPVSLVSLVDEDRQFFLSHYGLTEPLSSQRETPLTHSFCQHMVSTRAPLIIDDAKNHPLVRDNLAIRDLNVQAYAGLPLTTTDGSVIGSFCVIDTQPRKWTDNELGILDDLAASVITEITLRSELTERLRAENAMRDAQDKYNTLFYRSLEPVFINDVQGNFLDANDAALDLLGYTREELPSVNFATIMSETDVNKAFIVVQEVLERGFQDATSEFHLRKKDGDTAFVETRSALLYQDGQPDAMLGIARDITTHKRAESLLQEALRKEKELSEFKTRLFSMISHEFRTPLAAILTSSSLLKDYSERLSEDRKRQGLEQIEDDVRKLMAMTDQLLALGRADSTRETFVPVEVDMFTLCQTFIAETQATTSKHDIKLSNQAEKTLACIDIPLIRSALVNLLGNAVKYSPDGGSVTVELSNGPDTLIIQIGDDGIGIPQAEMNSLFAEFHRATNVDQIPGTGLGLSIVKRAVDLHNGTVSVESTVSQGTRFTIALPLAQGIDAPPHQDTTRTDTPRP